MKKALSAIVMCALLLCTCSCVKKNESEKASLYADPYVFYLENGLYDIGEFSSGERYRHFTGESVYEFVPRDDYGPLLPFSGEVKQYYSKDVPMAYGFDMSYSKYGLCTTDGKVVVEPVYAYISSFTSDDGFRYFDLTCENDIEVDEHGRILSYDDVFMADKRVIIPGDGSWKIELENGSYVSGAGDGIITICRYDSQRENNEYRMYNYNGEFLFTVDNYEHIEAYSDGYAVARIYSQYSHDAKNSANTGICVYLDKKGNAALDGYTDGTGFNGHGVASVQIDGDKYALINTDGEFLTEAVYDSLYGAGIDGYYQGFIEDSKEMHVFDGKGNVIGTVTGKGTGYMSLTKLPDGDIAYSYYDSLSDGELWYRLSDNSPLVCKENGKMPNDYTYTNNLFIYKDKKDISMYSSDAPAILFNADGDTVAKLDRYRYANWIDRETGLMGYVRSNLDAKPKTDEEKMMYGTVSEDEFVIFDTVAGEETAVFKNCHYAQCIPGFNGIVAVQTEKRNGDDIKVEYYFYDIKNKCMLKGFENIEQYSMSEADGKQYISVCRNDSIAVYDKDFNIILKKHLDKNV